MRLTPATLTKTEREWLREIQAVSSNGQVLVARRSKHALVLPFDAPEALADAWKKLPTVKLVRGGFDVLTRTGHLRPCFGARYGTALGALMAYRIRIRVAPEAS